jgi:hypothetical protein
MRNREYVEKRRMVRRQQAQVISAIEGFAKRSKLITIVYNRSFWGRVCMQINISKYNKVVSEMVEYIKTFCDYVEEENNGSMWLRNYDDLAEEDEDVWALKYEICLHHN